MPSRNARIDYDSLAARYDAHRSGEGPYLDVLASLARKSKAERLLEIGVGTGNVASALGRRWPCRLYGIDASRAMLAQARGKRCCEGFILGSGEALPFADSSFDFVYGSYVLHHILDANAAITEAVRTVGCGAAAFVTASHDFIRRHPVNAFFPSFAAIDTARFQPVEQLLEHFRDAGCVEWGSETVHGGVMSIDAHYLAKIEEQFISTYALLPPQEFKSGLAKLKHEVQRNGTAGVPFQWESVVVWGKI